MSSGIAAVPDDVLESGVLVLLSAQELCVLGRVSRRFREIVVRPEKLPFRGCRYGEGAVCEHGCALVGQEHSQRVFAK